MIQEVAADLYRVQNPSFGEPAEINQLVYFKGTRAEFDHRHGHESRRLHETPCMQLKESWSGF